MPKVLVIEDNDKTAVEIITTLKTAGYDVWREADGARGLETALDGGFEAIALDRMLPKLEGLEVVSRMHAAGVFTPVLVVSALSDVDDRIAGLRAGGDDYLIKPFEPGELVARIEAMLRRREWAQQSAMQLKVADLELDLSQRKARRGEREISLFPAEFKLLEFLARNAGQVLSRRMIFEKVWGYYFDPGTNVIEVHVSRLRRSVDGPGERPLIKTVRSRGYMLDAI